ncbi:hypothetical protein DFH08DRAFT_937594 [Mycena albidolilacea]|uniref:F-box domain-containing protein n=1 Tax=Mycena albidolilacea TaxID=1033008 RepID=A0AAD7EPQ2_9AGAR|nr:hypothetical protein DFH08DRAFT_937594 [Mycena albidolilacea]
MAGSFPADVLVELFHLLPEPETLFVHGLFNVAGVNQAWRAAALSCGTLWSCIRTAKRRDRRLLPLLLERSRTAPLDVRLDLFCSAYGIAPTDTTPQERAAVVKALLPHVYRIQKLYIRHMLFEPETEDAVTILKLVDAGLEFTTLREYTHEHMGQNFRPSPESDSPLNLTAPNLRALSLNGTRPRAWPTLLAHTLVELDITAEGTPLDMDLIATIFQQCRALMSLTLRKAFHRRHPPLSSPVSHPRFDPPPSLRVLDLHMPMSEILAVLRLFAYAPPLHSITVCDDKGLRPRAGQTTFEPTDHPILEHMIAGLVPLVAFEVHSDRNVILRDASGRARCFRVDAEDSACLDTRALWIFLVARCSARWTVRTLLGTTKAWSWLTRAFAGAPRPNPHGGGLELRMCVDSSACAQFPLTLPVLRKLTLHPAKYASGVNISVEGVLALLSMARTRSGSVVVCLGEVPLDVPPRRYISEFAKLSAEIKRAGAGASVGPAWDPMWVPCAHCAERAEATGDLGRCTGFDVAPTIGAMKIGVLFAVCLFGALTVPASFFLDLKGNYLNSKLKTDSFFLKALVHTIAICNAIYILTVVQYGHPELLEFVPDSLNLTIVISSFIGPLEQLLALPPRLLCLPLRTRACGSVVVGAIACARPISVVVLMNEYGWIVEVLLVIGAVTDIILVLGLCYYLSAWREDGFERLWGWFSMNRLVNRLIQWSIGALLKRTDNEVNEDDSIGFPNTDICGFGSVGAIALLICFVTMKETFNWIAISTVLPKLRPRTTTPVPCATHIQSCTNEFLKEGREGKGLINPT